jgi:UDP-glucose 4-epimerase
VTGSILVTGGAGFIGSHVAEAFLREGWKVAVVDDLSTGKRENLPGGGAFYERDIAVPGALEDVFAAERPSVVCHHAAQTSVRRSTGDPAHDLRVNILGTLNLVTESLRQGVKLFLFASTGGAIYGDDVPLPTSETAPCRPVSPYGVAKLGAEHYLEWAERTQGLPTLRLRYANVYGPRQDPLGEAGVVAIFSRLMLKGGRPVINGDGRQTRDYVYVGDVVNANLLGVEKGLSGTYNVGTGRETDVITLFDRLADVAAFRGAKIHGPAQPGEQARSCLDPSLLEERCGWRASMELSQGLERTVAWFREKRDEK